MEVIYEKVGKKWFKKTLDKVIYENIGKKKH